MIRPNIYIAQIVGVVILLCFFLIGNQPDRLSVMHFNPDPVQQMVMSQRAKSSSIHSVIPAKFASKGQGSRKCNEVKLIKCEMAMAVPTAVCTPGFAVHVVYAFPLPENFEFLFYREINPPPPKFC